MSVLSAAQSGDTLGTLRALRDTIALEIDNEPAARDLASLSKRLLEVMSDIDELSRTDEGGEVADAATAPDEEWSS